MIIQIRIGENAMVMPNGGSGNHVISSFVSNEEALQHGNDLNNNKDPNKLQVIDTKLSGGILFLTYVICVVALTMIGVWVLFGVIIAIFPAFGISAFIGWVYTKIKSRKIKTKIKKKKKDDDWL